MYTEVSTEQTPPLFMPLSFFISSILGGIFASLYLFVYSNSIIVSRWYPQSLTVLHLFVLTLILPTMIGALFQFLPIMTASPWKKPILLNQLVYWTYWPGVISLLIGFHTQTWHPIQVILISFLLLNLLSLAILFIIKTSKMGGRSPSCWSLMLGLISLVFVIGFASLLLLGHLNILPIYRASLTPLHFSFGFAGWIFSTIMAISFQVLPMFFVTPKYPITLQKFVIVLILFGLSIYYFNSGLGTFLLMLAQVAFFIQTVALLGNRKRKKSDPTILFFYIGFSIQSLNILLWSISSDFFKGLLILFCILALISGMLIKIFPFLFWLHSQNLQIDLLSKGKKIPLTTLSMNLLLPNSFLYTLVGIYGFSIFIFLIAFILPNLLKAYLISFGALLIVFFLSYILFLIYRAYIIYRMSTKALN